MNLTYLKTFKMDLTYLKTFKMAVAYSYCWPFYLSHKRFCDTRIFNSCVYRLCLHDTG